MITIQTMADVFFQCTHTYIVVIAGNQPQPNQIPLKSVKHQCQGSLGNDNNDNVSILRVYPSGQL